jgi:hypothetical protein
MRVYVRMYMRKYVCTCVYMYYACVRIRSVVGGWMDTPRENDRFSSCSSELRFIHIVCTLSARARVCEHGKSHCVVVGSGHA